MLLNVILMLTLLSAIKAYVVKDVERKEVNMFQDRQCFGPAKSIPDWFDWRDHGKVTPVKNQMHCGACWAFSIVAAVESHRLIHLNISQKLSEQFLIDCIGNYGCNHAPILMTLGYIVGQYLGILRDEDYKPYQDKQTICTYPPSGTEPVPIPTLVTGFRRVKALCGERNMADALYQNGPLLAAINSASMAKYTGGIDEPTHESCDADYNALDHTVLVVGYNVYVDRDSNRTVPYWIIKNSWGTGWGDNGYYYLVRGKNACGIGWDVSYPFVN